VQQPTHSGVSVVSVISVDVGDTGIGSHDNDDVDAGCKNRGDCGGARHRGMSGAATGQ
jgi:hypothetical protein